MHRGTKSDAGLGGGIHEAAGCTTPSRQRGVGWGWLEEVCVVAVRGSRVVISVKTNGRNVIIGPVPQQGNKRCRTIA